MTNSSITKRALIMSIVSLLLCFTMLLGTTFAWFTDEVVNTDNKIISGNLKVDLAVLENNNTTWTSVAKMDEPIFDYDYWEPEFTEMKILRVENEGTLALKWKASLVAKEEINQSLAEAIEVYIQEDIDKYPDNLSVLDDNWVCLGTLDDFIENIETTTTGEIQASEDGKPSFETLGIAFRMVDNADNSLQGEKLGEFDILILATQTENEEDSFGNDYDADADFEDNDEEQGDTEEPVQPENPEDKPTAPEIPKFAGTTTVTAETLTDIDFTKDDTLFVFEGEFESINIETMPGLKQGFDGANAKITGNEKTDTVGALRLGYENVIDSYATIKDVERTGEYYVYGFTAETINVAVHNTSVYVIENIAEFMDIDSGNINAVVYGNTFDSNNEKHTTYQNVESEYAFYMAAVDYNLVFDNNTIMNTLSHGMAINGRQANIASELDDTDVTNTVSSFTYNKISNTTKTALKIWHDTIYAPNDAQNDLDSDAAALINAIIAEENCNEFNEIGKELFSMYGWTGNSAE